jgi:hypothetical protein
MKRKQAKQIWSYTSKCCVCRYTTTIEIYITRDWSRFGTGIHQLLFTHGSKVALARKGEEEVQNLTPLLATAFYNTK